MKIRIITLLVDVALRYSAKFTQPIYVTPFLCTQEICQTILHLFQLSIFDGFMLYFRIMWFIFNDIDRLDATIASIVSVGLNYNSGGIRGRVPDMPADTVKYFVKMSGKSTQIYEPRN
uniref:Uncharacterized protein n=1 Tax=Rhizophagus irregularis (strain DAOM 181602 / DAOM 197198 / MUCL 43194) TaxID=747089 RepID=U9SXJ4_RHIID